MGNRLFQEARRSVDMAKMAVPSDQQMTILQAKNALSSAYANSTKAEQAQLSELQEELDLISKSPHEIAKS